MAVPVLPVVDDHSILGAGVLGLGPAQVLVEGVAVDTNPLPHTTLRIYKIKNTGSFNDNQTVVVKCLLHICSIFRVSIDS